MAAQDQALKQDTFKEPLMELTSPLNVENATRKMKLSIISPVNAQH